MSKVVPSEGQVTAASPISVQLIKNHHPGASPIIVITWPGHVTECSPAKLAEVVSSACRILSNGSTELARIQLDLPRRDCPLPSAFGKSGVSGSVW